MAKKFLGAAALMLAAGLAAAQAPAPLELIAFPGGSNWPIWIAQEKGLFAQNADRLVAFIRAYVAAIDWIYQPANRAEALDIYQKYVKDTEREIAAKAYDAMLSGNEGFQRKAKLDVEGIRTILRLRSEFAKPPKQLTDPMKYVDESYYERALR